MLSYCIIIIRLAKFIIAQLQVYKEDFEQERKDRENAHHIKEEEIQKIRVEQEALRAEYNDNIKHIQDNYKTQLNTYVHKVGRLCY